MARSPLRWRARLLIVIGAIVAVPLYAAAAYASSPSGTGAPAAPVSVSAVTDAHMVTTAVPLAPRPGAATRRGSPGRQGGPHRGAYGGYPRCARGRRLLGTGHR